MTSGHIVYLILYLIEYLVLLATLKINDILYLCFNVHLAVYSHINVFSIIHINIFHIKYNIHIKY